MASIRDYWDGRALAIGVGLAIFEVVSGVATQFVSNPHFKDSIFNVVMIFGVCVWPPIVTIISRKAPLFWGFVPFLPFAAIIGISPQAGIAPLMLFTFGALICNVVIGLPIRWLIAKIGKSRAVPPTLVPPTYVDDSVWPPPPTGTNV